MQNQRLEKWQGIVLNNIDILLNVEFHEKRCFRPKCVIVQSQKMASTCWHFLEHFLDNLEHNNSVSTYYIIKNIIQEKI